jgi:hypothetical protein
MERAADIANTLGVIEKSESSKNKN